MTTTIVSEIVTLKIFQTQYKSFEEIVKVAKLNNVYYKHLDKNEKCKNFIFAPIVSSEEEGVVLYYEGENQSIPGGANIYKYFADKGYEVIPNTHSSLLIQAVKELTDEKLEELGIPSYVDIVIPTPENSLLPDEDDYPCFLEVSRYLGYRRLDLVNFQGRVVQLLCFSPPQEEKIGFLIYKPLGS